MDILYLNCIAIMQTLLGWKSVDPWLVERLFMTVRAPDQQEVTLETLIMAMAMCLKVPASVT